MPPRMGACRGIGLNCGFLPGAAGEALFLFPSSLERQRPALGKRGADLDPFARSVSTCKDRAQLLNKNPARPAAPCLSKVLGL